MGDDMSHLIKRGSQQPQHAPVVTRVVKPAEQLNVKLGKFHHDLPPKGFIVEYKPRIESTASVVIKIITVHIDNSDMYELVLFFANFSQYTLTVKVWRT